MMRSRYFPFTRAFPFALLALACMAPSGAWARPKYQVLHNFTGGDGGGILSGVILDAAGNVYGTTLGGGTHLYGTAFELRPSRDGWTETVLHNFCAESGCTDGQGPAWSLTFDPAGNLYGSAGGGSSDGGVVFELSPGSGGWNYDVLYESGSNTPLTLDKTGNLYVAIGAGAYGAGAIGELTPGSPYWIYHLLYSFDLRKGHHDGFGPLDALIFGTAGNLYGTTVHGGVDGYGIIFELAGGAGGNSPGERAERILHSFPTFPGDGELPYSGLVFDHAGNLYGATAGGGTVNSACPQGCGTIFKLTPVQNGKWKETILHKFPNVWDGASPVGTLVFDQAGNLYGATAGGGKSQNCNGGCGTVFKMTPGSSGKWKYTVLHRFDGNDGANPQAGVTLDKEGNIYGTTVQGGSGFDGVVFEITP